jgi:hypothetical protein
MTHDIQELKHKRFQYLKKLYDTTEGSELAGVNFQQLGDELGFSHSETDRIEEYLVGEGLIEHVSLGGEIGITHRGVVEVESALSKPDEPTTYFPPVNYIHVEQMIGSQIQQGTNQSSQVLTYSTNDIEAIAKFVADLKARLPDLKLDAETQAEAESDTETIESQIKSPRPKHAIIKECLLSLRKVLESAAGGAIGALLVQQIIALIK